MSEIGLNKADVSLDANSRHHETNTCIEPDLGLPCDTSHNYFNLHPNSQAESLVPHFAISYQSEVPDKITQPGNYSETMMIDGVPRHYNLHVPPTYDASKPTPLVLVLHGHGDDATGAARISGMDAEADKHGFIVAYPEAVHWLGSRSLAAWDTGNGLVPPGNHADDSSFLRKVIETSQSQLSIDPSRTYLLGFSNGGMEAYKAATELSDKLAAVVAVSGAMGGGEQKPNSPVSFMSIVGTSDDGVPYTGRTKEEEAVVATNPNTIQLLSKLFPGTNEDPNSPEGLKRLQEIAVKSGFVPDFKPLTYATDFWKSADGITTSGTTTHDPGITREIFTNPQTGVAVEQEIVAGGDHMIQHGAPASYNLADEVWQFLAAHPKTS